MRIRFTFTFTFAFAFGFGFFTFTFINIHAFYRYIICIWYFTEVMKAKYSMYKVSHIQEKSEGFEDKNSLEKPEDPSLYTWITQPQSIYDDFYVGIYDELLGQTQRTQAKVELCIDIWKSKEPISTWSVLDAGCGTGVASCYFAKKGAGNVIALDYSTSMITYAQKETPKKLQLTEKEFGNIRWPIRPRDYERLVRDGSCDGNS